MHGMTARCAQAIAGIELSAGNATEAVDALRRSDRMLERSGARATRSTTLAILAEALECAGEIELARAALDAAEELGGPEDATNFVTAHTVRSRIALRLGDHDGARQAAEAAVEIADKTEFPTERAHAALALARVLWAHGDRQRGRGNARAALDLFAVKGDVPGSAAARALIRTC
jgi:ATP/maltotriose-dependent transcriptional regulator MalT